MTTVKGYVDPDYLSKIGDFLDQLKQGSYTRMHIQPGHKVLDVGCGPATDTIRMAQLVGPTGLVMGVDHDHAMIVEAESSAEKAGVSSWVKHKGADATSLPFESGYFDSCRSERLFQHLLDPAGALAEMSRVTKTGGWIVVLDTDWGSIGIDTIEIDIERRLTRFYPSHMVNNGHAGRQLYRLFKRQGLADVSYDVFPLTLTSYPLAREIWTMDELEREALTEKTITEEELYRFKTDLEQADAMSVFFCYGCMIQASGRKAI